MLSKDELDQQKIEFYSKNIEEKCEIYAMKESQIFCENNINQLVDLLTPYDIDHYIKNTTNKIIFEHTMKEMKTQLHEKIKILVSNFLEKHISDIKKKIRKSKYLFLKEKNEKEENKDENKNNEIEKNDLEEFSLENSFVISNFPEYLEEKKQRLKSIYNLEVSLKMQNFDIQKEEYKTTVVILLKIEKSIFDSKKKSNSSKQNIFNFNDSLSFLQKNYFFNFNPNNKFTTTIAPFLVYLLLELSKELLEYSIFEVSPHDLFCIKKNIDFENPSLKNCFEFIFFSLDFLAKFDHFLLSNFCFNLFQFVLKPTTKNQLFNCFFLFLSRLLIDESITIFSFETSFLQFLSLHIDHFETLFDSFVEMTNNLLKYNKKFSPFHFVKIVNNLLEDEDVKINENQKEIIKKFYENL